MPSLPTVSHQCSRELPSYRKGWYSLGTWRTYCVIRTNQVSGDSQISDTKTGNERNGPCEGNTNILNISSFIETGSRTKKKDQKCGQWGTKETTRRTPVNSKSWNKKAELGTLSTFLSFSLAILLLKMAPRCRAEMLSGVPKNKRAMMWPVGKIHVRVQCSWINILINIRCL